MLPGNVDTTVELEEVEKYRKSRPLGEDDSDKRGGKLRGDDPNWKIKVGEGQETLADVKRRQREELAEALEEGVQKRYKIVNFTSEDSHVVNEKKLFSFYCSICGEHAVASDIDILTMPRRSTDNAIALEEAVYFHKKYANFGERILLRRQNGVEKQYRFYCRQCRQPLGYRSSPPTETSKYSYFYNGAVVTSQSAAVAFQK